jgi:hypothetical protein
MCRRRIDVDSIQHHPSSNDDEHDPGDNVLSAADDAGPDDQHYPA